MDAYLDPSLGGTLAFLDPSSQLHAAADATSQPLTTFDYDAWLDPVGAPAYDAAGSLSVTHGAPSSAVLSLDARGALSSAHSFGVHLNADPTMGARASAAPMSPMATSVSSSGSNGALHLSYGAGDFGGELFHPRSVLSSHSYNHQPASPVSTASASGPVASGPASMSIAMYDRQADVSGKEQLSGYAGFPKGSADNGVGPKIAQSQRLPARQPSNGKHSAYAKPLQQSSARANGQTPTTGTKTPKTPQADESVPEAALHLLRLALPTGSTGSVATNMTGDDEDASCDEDAEGESDDTSIHSTEANSLAKLFPEARGAIAQPPQLETTVWNHAEDQPPLHVQRGGGPGSRRTSVASSAASTRVRQHIPARTQRENSIAPNRSRAGSEAPSLSGATSSSSQQGANVAAGPASAVGRRTSGRVRKTVLPSQPTDVDSDATESEGEYQQEDAEADADDSDSGKGKKKKGGKATATKGKGKMTKRVSNAAGNPTPAKKARTSAAANPPRKPRRQAYIPPNLQNRTFPPGVELNSSFPRFYRTFPISSAISPESYVHKVPSSSSNSRSATQVPQLDLLPTPPVTMYNQFAFGAAAQYHSAGQIGSTSAAAAGLPNISMDATGAFVLHDPHAHQYPQHSQPHPNYSHAALPPPPQHLPHPHAMSPPHLAHVHQHQPHPVSPLSQASSSGSAAAAGITFMQPPPDAKWNKAGDPFNLYYPRFVKGNADDKCGMCPICAEPPERGGEGEQKWLKLKNSSYVYHMSYAHGLSNLTGLPFSPPTSMRIVDLPNSTKDTRSQMTQGLCHKCNEWIPLLSVKNIDAIVPELIWWKHAKKCHGESTIPGERDPFVIDDVYNFVYARKQEHSAGGGPPSSY
ncbi:hypothetical protein JCM1841_000972 [Sporobolomyces salmonicolor]